MDPITRAMFMGAAGTAGEEIPIGTFLEGGYFAGYISQTADGNATHGLIVAPAASGYNGKSTLQWKTTNTSTSGTSSVFDGAANTASIFAGYVSQTADGNHPAAIYCAGLSIGGYSDWYLPARYELEIAYYNLKPTTASNNNSVGTNIYAVPQRGSNYTTGDPTQTSVAAFKGGNNLGAEAFVENFHWSSTENTATDAWGQVFTTGAQALFTKTISGYVRAFRKFAV